MLTLPNAILAFSKRVYRARAREGFLSVPKLKYEIETEREADDRWIAEISDLPGVMTYGTTKEEAIANAEAIALRVIADRIEQSKKATAQVSFACA